MPKKNNSSRKYNTNFNNSKSEILKEIQMYDSYKKQAKERHEYNVAQYYKKHLDTLWKKYKNTD